MAARPGREAQNQLLGLRKEGIRLAGCDHQERQRRLGMLEQWEKVKSTVRAIEQGKKRQDAPWSEVARGDWLYRAVLRQLEAGCHYQHYAEYENSIYEATWHDDRVRRPEEKLIPQLHENPYAIGPNHGAARSNLCRIYAQSGLGEARRRTARPTKKVKGGYSHHGSSHLWLPRPLGRDRGTGDKSS